MAASQRYCNPAISARRKSESVLAGSNGDGDILLQPDDGGACLSAGGEADGGNGGAAWSSVALDSKLCDIRIHSYSYSTFSYQKS